MNPVLISLLPMVAPLLRATIGQVERRFGAKSGPTKMSTVLGVAQCLVKGLLTSGAITSAESEEMFRPDVLRGLIELLVQLEINDKSRPTPAGKSGEPAPRQDLPPIMLQPGQVVTIMDSTVS